jgi:subtilase family serine protease
MRVYPDLANVGDPNTGYVIGFTDTLNNYTTEKIGGTSLASPRTAGQLALAIEQNNGRRLGFLNPTLYSSAAKNGLTDLSDNTPLPASYKLDDSLSFFGLPALPEVNTYNGQSLAHQSLSLAPGYDNLSGQGAITDQSAFATMVTGG